MNIAEVKTKIDNQMNIISKLTDQELDNLLNLVGYFNSLAHKGKRRYSEQEETENLLVYSNKNQYLYSLVCEFVKRGRSVASCYSVIFFYRLDGVQVSFHTRTTISQSEIEIKMYSLIKQNAQWDGVENAFAYGSADIEEYNYKKSKRKELENAIKEYGKQLEDDETEKTISYLSKYHRAQKYCDEFIPETKTIKYKSWDHERYVYFKIFGVLDKCDEHIKKISDYVSANFPEYIYLDEIKELSPKKYKGE